MRRKHIRAVLFGPQGAGKSQQAALLAERFGVPLVSSGDAFRAEIAEASALGDLAREYVEGRMFTPDDLANAIVARRLKGMDLEKGFVIDGYPRNVDQAETLDRLAKVNLAIHLRLSDATAVKRLAGRLVCTGCRMIVPQDGMVGSDGKTVPCPVCGARLMSRGKDDEETVRRRLAAYHFMTEPLAGYYRQRGVLLAVNAEQTVADLFEEFNRKLAKLGFVT